MDLESTLSENETLKYLYKNTSVVMIIWSKISSIRLQSLELKLKAHTTLKS